MAHLPMRCRACDERMISWGSPALALTGWKPMGDGKIEAPLPRLHASSNGAGSRPALKMMVGSSSYSPSSASPDVANATTPALVAASFSPILWALSDDLH